MADTETRELLPDVKTYFAAVEAAHQTLREAESALGDKYPKLSEYATDEGREQRRAYRVERDTAGDAHATACEVAWDALKASGDPLVKWIAENAGMYRNEAGHVLKALPASLEELDTLAEDQDWCGTWSGFRDRAIAAGVMPGYVPPTPAFKAVLEGIDAEACCTLGSRSQRRISTLLAALVAEAKGEQVAA